MLKENIFESKVDLEVALVAEILGKLRAAIEENGKAGILFSGGSTPKGLFQLLAKADFDWSNVNIGLVDDRVVAEDDENSNILFIKNYLLAHLNTDFHFHPWVIHANDLERNMELAEASLKAFGKADVAILGMGTDGHFASLFPGDESSEVGLKLSNRQKLIYTRAPAVPRQRISLSWAYLRHVPNLYLHITGAAKKSLLEDSEQRKNLPINYVVEDKEKEVNLYWAP